MTARVLVVEDDPGVASGLVRGLKAAGFGVELCCDGDAALPRLLADEHDLVVLDINLPGRDGLALLAEVKGRSPKPTIILTARTDLESRLSAFENGAVDFVSKPFWMAELVARIRTRLALPAASRTVGVGGVTIDLDARVARRGDDRIDLTPHEFNVLAWLVERPERPATRAQLIEQCLPPDSGALERTIDSHIARIRKKLGPEGKSIETVWRVGYRFVPPGPA